MLLLLLGAGWVAGIFLGSAGAIWPALGLAAGGAGLAAAARSRGLRTTLVAGLVLATLGGGFARAAVAMPALDPPHVAAAVGREVVLIGTVVREPETSDRWQRLRVTAERLRDDYQWRPASGDVLVTLPRFPEWHYGERVEVTGKLEPPPTRPHWYAPFLRRQAIHAVMQSFESRGLGTGEGVLPLGALLDLRGRLARALAVALPEPGAGLAQGLLLGLRSGLPDDLAADFARSGLSHVLAVSGYNIALVVGFLSPLAVRLVGRARSFYLVLPGIVVYAGVAGLGPSVIRAAIMGGLAAAALHLGRPANTAGALALAAALMTAIEPTVLWDVGFQLSFLATVGLIALMSPLAGWLRLRVRSAWLRGPAEGLTTTLVAIAATAPLGAAVFGNLSLVTPLANLLALPAIPGATLAAAAVAGLGLVAPPAATLAGWIAWPFLVWPVVVVQVLGGLPFAALPVDLVPLPVVLYYLAFGALCFICLLPGGPASLRLALGRLRSWLVAQACPPGAPALAGLGLAAAIIWGAVSTTPGGETRLWLLDTGRGEAALLRTAGGRTALIDGGGSPERLLAELGRYQPFYDQQVALVALTSPSEDRLAGLVELAGRRRLVRALSAEDGPTNALGREWRTALAAAGVTEVPSEPGLLVDLADGVGLEVIDRFPTGDAGASALLLRLRVGGQSVLFAGPLSLRDQERLVAEGADLKAELLILPGHAGPDSLSPAFLEAVGPSAAALFVGSDGRSGRPADATLELLGDLPLFRIDREGTIAVRFDGVDLFIERALSGRQ